MKNMLVPIDGAGRIVLPKEVREELDIAAGDRFHVSASEGQVTLTPERGAPGLIRKGKALVFAAPGKARISAAEVEELIRIQREPMRDRLSVSSRQPRRR